MNILDYNFAILLIILGRNIYLNFQNRISLSGFIDHQQVMRNNRNDWKDRKWFNNLQ